MKLAIKKERKYPKKPEWKIILDHLVYQDQMLVYRLCRKMIIYLDRMKIPDLQRILEDLNPIVENKNIEQNVGSNWPKPKGSPFNPSDIIDELFDIADANIDDERITYLLKEWIHQEQIGFLSLVLEKRHAPLQDVVEAVKKYLKLSYSHGLQSIEERIGLRVSLIYRFLSENLTYINIAKKYITISEMSKILERVIGPGQGNGKLGGKSAGMILARQIIIDHKKTNPLFDDVTTPKSRFLTSDGLYDFLHYNALEEFVYTKYQDPSVVKQEYNFLEYIFKNSHFPSEAEYALNKVLDEMEGKPIVIRSSSLLEDSFEGAFSGKYKSLFLANTGTKTDRMAALVNAIAEVFASTFSPDPIEYRRERGFLDFREEMGILIQQVVGNKIGKYYLPSFAGVAFSNNEFRWSQRISRNDGVVRLVAGLGTRAVDRTIDDYPTLVSPGQPGLKVNQTTEDQIRYSQRFVDVINLETNEFETISFKKLIDDCKGNYPGLEKIVSFNRLGTLIDPISAIVDFCKEDSIVTFNPLIKNTQFIEKIKEILQVLQKSYGGPVDIEFAHDNKKFYLLQCRPQSQFDKDVIVNIPTNIALSKKVFSANEFVNNGIVLGIEYVVYVDSVYYSELQNKEDYYEVGNIVSELNKKLPRKKFILMGPGRWGSKGDIKLGVPVIYSDLNNTAVLIEIAREKGSYVPELSFGTHFFQDLVEANIKYLPLYPDKNGNIFNDDFFDKSKNSLIDLIPDAEKYKNVVKVIKLSDINKGATLSVFMDGEKSQAVGFIDTK